ncbi:hypothetical protein [Vulcanisaeta sp. JCM 16159]|uniref:hypothetical protein n=1 Tax=Vulcanisaeta sp. JCM 16159 TaxID=1295371 RepID=UPI0006CF972A|nr:hypothetical protein [Vulcanisaeta sp. JCM 16159]
MDVIKEVSNDVLRLAFIKDNQSFLLEVLRIDGFNEESYRRLRRYIKERLGEEFSSIISLESGKALAKVLLIGADQVGQSLINDVIDNELNKVNSWISSGVIKEIIDKVSGELKETRKSRKSRKKKRKRKGRKSKGSKGSKSRSKRSRSS